MRRQRLSFVAVAVTAVAVVLGGGTATGQPSGTDDRATAEYLISGARGVDARTEVASTGAVINSTEHGTINITATPGEVRKLRGLGYKVERQETRQRSSDPSAMDFPPEDSDYHNYDEMMAEIDKAVTDHPDLISRQVIGQSYEGRDILALKISDNPDVDEDEPEVLFTHQQHAREHLTVEMALYSMNLFTDSYGSDPEVTDMVNSREIWIVPTMNPDGSEYDIETGNYRGWRKNRQPNSGSSYVGTDLNRNWDYKWGCCGGSSGSPSSDTYRGSAPESSPEVKLVADFVRSRVVGGEQQITAGIDFHTFSELILWPYGYTYDDTAPGLDADDQKVFQTLGEEMAATNGYTPEQSSDLYITDGTINDWMWAEQGIYSYTFEMYPSSGGLDGFYPDDEVIDRETSRNKEAMLHLLSYADCPPRAIGQTCDGSEPPDDDTSFENTDNVNIPDNGSAVYSDVVVSGVSGNAPSDLKAKVDIVHTYRGDLVIDLVAPDGTEYRLKDASYWDGADDVRTTYTVDASSESADGTWRLKVRDTYSYDTGYIDAVRLTF
ncbi:M14 family zinc carboxypeptidase [Haloechinothrix salitolerans]|uniref:M14 family zinc carboxypeptidase n=1 Tax=Haloechinothrix salitolerans TaxID=926830 RepID=A0ABW2BX15_9PSEU